MIKSPTYSFRHSTHHLAFLRDNTICLVTVKDHKEPKHIITGNLNIINGNVAFICWRFYRLALVKELRIDDESRNRNTYVSIAKSKINIVNHHKIFLKDVSHSSRF